MAKHNVETFMQHPYDGWVICNICKAKVYERYIDFHLKVHAHNFTPTPIPATVPMPVSADSSKEEQSSLKRSDVVSGSTRRTKPFHKTISDIVENVAYIGEVREVFQTISGAWHPKSETAYCNCEECVRFGRKCVHTSGIGKTGTIIDSEPIELNGWILQRESVKIGRKKSLYAKRFASENMEVFILNVSEHPAGYEYVVSSPNKDAVMSFLKDFDLTAEIDDMDSVCQTS